MKYILFQLLFNSLSGALDVWTPEPTVIAVHGCPAVLQCLFPSSLDSGTATDLNLVVTWQTVHDSRVVHSFYHGIDQLEHQSSAFNTRTSVFPFQLAGGNASLRLETVGPEDEGRYLCSVSNIKGTGKAEVQLRYAAYYTEPRLIIWANASHTEFCYESEGYPQPEVQWTNSSGHNLESTTTVSNVSRVQGLLSLNTLLVVERSKPVSYNFTLKNPLLKQDIQRTVSLNYASSGPPVILARTQTSLLFTLITGLGMII